MNYGKEFLQWPGRMQRGNVSHSARLSVTTNRKQCVHICEKETEK